jgi:DNA-binding MarR family transcriptional regulator
MGRPEKEIDTELLLELSERGLSQKQLAEQLSVSVPTLSKRIADLQQKQGLLLKYRDLQSLQLTALQARILEAITPEKIDGASLKELIGAFDILKKHERVAEGLPSDIKGLVGYLTEIEKEEARVKLGATSPDHIAELQRLADGVWAPSEMEEETDEDDEDQPPFEILPNL